jgi:hypothetical protein
MQIKGLISRYATATRVSASQGEGVSGLTVEVDVDSVETDQEVAKGLLLGFRDILEQSRDDGLPRRELQNGQRRSIKTRENTYRLVNSDQKLHSLGVDISDFDTTFVSEEDPVAFTGRVDADIVFGFLGMGQERLDDERVQGTGDLFDLTRLAGEVLDPFARDLVVLVKAEETGLSSSLDELIGLCDELVCGDVGSVSVTIAGSVAIGGAVVDDRR